MKNLTGILITWFLISTITEGKPWCPCRNKIITDKSDSFSIQNKLDYNPTRPPQNYIDSDQFRWNPHNDRQDNPNLEIFPNEFNGQNPLQFHVEADFDEPNVISEDYFGKNTRKFKFKHQPQQKPKWYPRLKPPNRPFLKPRPEMGLKNHKNFKGGEKKKLFHWPLPLKLIDSFLPYPPPFLQLKKHRQQQRFKPHPNNHHYKPEMNNYNQNEEMDHYNHNPGLNMVDDFRQNENQSGEDEEVDFPPDVMQAFLENNQLNHNTQWSEHSDPELGFKNVRVVMPTIDDDHHFELQTDRMQNPPRNNFSKCRHCGRNMAT